MSVSNYSKVRKIMLTAGAVISLVSVFVIYPIEYSKSSYVSDFILSITGITIGTLLILYGLTGGLFIKYLGFLVLSAITGFFCWYFYPVADNWWSGVMALYCGIPSGIIAALLFFIIRYYLFFRNKAFPVDRSARNILFLKQLVLYFVLLAIVSVLFLKGGDWIYDIFQS
ncbi:hypothetical protein [Pedobacter caeni]|uniref:Uncharacterized protein n=1 Tax=Pedobacter caeni TaxID=288992 RepID=A0A1M4UCP8_9SPHI|nr:hypothetical protein [Pedobacter caeni]SHE54330.1 hypothetical protein SAMN04488522_101505 [Pedobacter caeni]